ncbi:hypothetical protein D9758_004349 [Tetrapyrgos nigripes]|uniref:AB hydrolase-1 domain-containing protein n=1 Tax=Tetrapyrgos nigripes TaxID=182062 RepID=A0A8H5LSH6_9AGAR|nr:hypothetical protein D9758_004349 [Tetrapyrgos nigripes]
MAHLTQVPNGAGPYHHIVIAENALNSKQTVWQAKWHENGARTGGFERNVVVKIASTAEAVRKLEKEAEFYENHLILLQGDIVPRYYGFFRVLRREYACMMLEYCTGSVDPMNFDCEIMLAACKLHSSGIYHGDLSPVNTSSGLRPHHIVSCGNSVRLVDFSLAQAGHRCNNTLYPSQQGMLSNFRNTALNPFSSNAPCRELVALENFYGQHEANQHVPEGWNQEESMRKVAKAKTNEVEKASLLLSMGGTANRRIASGNRAQCNDYVATPEARRLDATRRVRSESGESRVSGSSLTLNHHHPMARSPSISLRGDSAMSSKIGAYGREGCDGPPASFRWRENAVELVDDSIGTKTYIYGQGLRLDSKMIPKILSLLVCASAALPVVFGIDVPPPFNQSFFKDLNVTRGLTYHYYAAPATVGSGKPTLVFLHGFPSSSYDWRHQVSFFQDQGYGLVVPDMLGYGGTAKPLDPQLYASSLICKDIVDIMDAEGIEQAILIGHDWGSKITTRLANYFPERFHAFAFLAVGEISPGFSTDFNESFSVAKAFLGYENFGYFDFLVSEGADQVIQEHLDSFFDAWFPRDTVQAIDSLCPIGALEAFLKNDTRIIPGEYVTSEERMIQKDLFYKDGYSAPLNWYKIVMSSVESDDDEGIPKENTSTQKPVFYGAALRDYCSIPHSTLRNLPRFAKGELIIHEYNTGHWIMLEARDQVSNDLLQWIEGMCLEGCLS